jgi:hypothetical protein
VTTSKVTSVPSLKSTTNAATGTTSKVTSVPSPKSTTNAALM